MRKMKFRYLMAGAAILMFVIMTGRIPVARSSQGSDTVRHKVQQESTESPTAEPTAPADTTQPPTASTEPLEIAVGIYLRSIEELNLNEGSFVADFYMTWKCSRACDDTSFEFTNGTVESQEKTYDAPLEKSFSIRAKLHENFNVRAYPFDSHTLFIGIEDSIHPVEEVRFVPDTSQTDVDPEIIISGWDIDSKWRAEVDDHHYPIYNSSYSRYRFYLDIQRPWLSGIIKGVLPVLFILIVGYSLLLLGHDRATEGMEVIAGALVGAILHHLYLASSIPPTGYLTYVDTFMSINYFVLIIIMGVIVRLNNLDEAENEQGARRLHDTAIWIVPTLFVVLQVANALIWSITT